MVAGELLVAVSTCDPPLYDAKMDYIDSTQLFCSSHDKRATFLKARRNRVITAKKKKEQ
jgi:hypothetical protein